MIYIDHFSFLTCIKVYNLIHAEKGNITHYKVQVLDPIKNTPFSWLLIRVMRFFGVSFKEADFFAGHLRTKEGEGIYLAGFKYLNEIAFEAARDTVENSKFLNELNEKWGKNTIVLFLADYYSKIAGNTGYSTVLKILIFKTITRDQKGNKHHLILGLPLGFKIQYLDKIRGTVNLNTYVIKKWSKINMRFSLLTLILVFYLKKQIMKLKYTFKGKQGFGNSKMPTLLSLQEDDTSLDRSYRGQPHWLFNDNQPPEFRSLIIKSNSNLFTGSDNDSLKKFHVYSIPRDYIFLFSEKHPVKQKINSVIRSLLFISIFSNQISRDCLFQLTLLFLKSYLLSGFCLRQNVKAFMTCENYHLDAYAMNLIGKDINVHTFSYQYSNMSEIGPTMMTTADTMISFSRLYHNRWNNNGIRIKEFVDMGYLFDSSFKLLVDRAKKVRHQLKNNGANFIITYLDEKGQKKKDKYGLIDAQDHFEEFSSLFRTLENDSSIGIITKSQFIKYSFSKYFSNNLLVNQAIQSGRFIELFSGKTRNVVFPAEAAMASDIVVGHVIGATAGLEVSLTGCRCILINPYDMKGANIDIFRKANILFNNINTALDAILLFRQGAPEYQNLGDWGTIIDKFDPFRDGQSASRLRESLNKVIN